MIGTNDILRCVGDLTLAPPEKQNNNLHSTTKQITLNRSDQGPKANEVKVKWNISFFSLIKIQCQKRQDVTLIVITKTTGLVEVDTTCIKYFKAFN